ncbi:DUF2865 domain-containing protein [Salinarimonas soli]|uniref:DUF2865 domain-containing protein n=1 Tax=Salinarimonas soli TaxID=1638099 RepID=A0A5B2VTW4_9HYPH|nr:DUF2865 domain-containing protein [Salinarimonas soli]KAA2242048.1 DUF2865 domain-containing protein [Salinarimonas soli]
MTAGSDDVSPRGGEGVAAVRAGLRAPLRRGRGRAVGLGVLLGLAALVTGAGMVRAADDAGIMSFFREEAARRLPAPVARVVVPAAVAQPARSAAAAPKAQPLRVASATASARAAGPVTGRSVCVRLCDGYFFPLGNLASDRDRPLHQASCEAACPQAEMALFTLPRGSADIGAARGSDGRPYRSLPQAFAHQSRRPAACSCQGPDNIASRLNPAQDPTLRRGDVIVGAVSAVAFAGERQGFEDFRRTRALGASARRQVDTLLAVSAREATREALLRTMRVVTLEPARPAASRGFTAVEPAGGFGGVGRVASSSFVALN